MKNNIICIDGLIFLNDKIIMPKVLRQDMLLLIHKSHLGIQKCKCMAREIIYWPGIYRHIENLFPNVALVKILKNLSVKNHLFHTNHQPIFFRKLE